MLRKPSKKENRGSFTSPGSRFTIHATISITRRSEQRLDVCAVGHRFKAALLDAQRFKRRRGLHGRIGHVQCKTAHKGLLAAGGGRDQLGDRDKVIELSGAGIAHHVAENGLDRPRV